MPAFGTRSLRNLEGIDSRLQDLASEVIKVADFSVLEGLRTPERQQELFDKGASKTLASRHLLGKAFDFAPYPIPEDWDPPRFIMLGGYILAQARAMSIPLRWGGDWAGNFKMPGWPAYGHIEIPKGDA